MTCPPCTHDCNQGETCPAKSKAPTQRTWVGSSDLEDSNAYLTQPAQPQLKQNFCSRCGKRTADPFTIHTCTPPKSAFEIFEEKNT